MWVTFTHSLGVQKPLCHPRSKAKSPSQLLEAQHYTGGLTVVLSVTAFSPSTWTWLYLGSSTRHSFCSHFSLHSPWALPTTLLQLCLLFSFRRCVEVTPAKTEEPEGVRTWLHHLTHCLYPYKQGNKDVAAPFPCVYRAIKAEPDRYQFFN